MFSSPLSENLITNMNFLIYRHVIFTNYLTLKLTTYNASNIYIYKFNIYLIFTFVRVRSWQR